MTDAAAAAADEDSGAPVILRIGGRGGRTLQRMPSRLDTLAAIVDTFAPGDAAGLPPASELGVHRAILGEVRALGRPSLESQLRLFLRAVENPVASLVLAGMPRRFSRASLAERETYLRRMATSPVPLTRTAFQDLKRLTFLLVYGMEDSPYRRATGFVPPVPDPADESVLDVRTPGPGEVIDADACVVGSGAGGGVAAAILAAAGKRVVVLERAGNVTEREFGGPELDGLAKLFLDRGLTATDDRWFSIRAGSAVGGGTVVNWSSSLRLPDAVREEWRAAGIDDLDPHYDAVEAETSVTTAESEHNGPNAALARGLDALGLPRQVIPRNVRGCTDCGPCAVGCRTGAKRSVLRTYLAHACANGASILDRTDARRILVRDGRVEGVVAAVPGGEITVRAPRVALAGGSILSPVLLQRSGIAPGVAGRTLRMHPVAAVAGVYPERIDAWSGVPQSVVSDAFAEIDGTHGFRVEASPMHPGIVGTALPWWSGPQHAAWVGRAAHTAAFLAIVRDRTPGRIEVDRDGAPRIRYAVGVPERRLLLRGMLELARLHEASGAGRIFTLHTPPLEREPGASMADFLAGIDRRGVSPNRVLLFTAHQMSSCRIGTDPRDSTADPDGRVRGVDGLWVTDASAFPTASGVNPMLTILALTRRTARRMAES
jgi:choline dehydrogenase-like flavoprotein